MTRALPGARQGCVLLLAGVLLLTGCTSGTDGDEPAAGPATTAPPSSPSSSASSGGGGAVDPGDLSRDLLATAAAAAAAEEELTPLGSQSLQVPQAASRGPMTVQVDVLRLERRADSTLVTVALSSPTDPVEGAQPDRGVFDESVGNAYFLRVALEDTAGGVRHYPLSWRRQVTRELSPPEPGPLNSCVCMFRQNLHLAPEPVVMDALYGPLPEGVDEVTLFAPDGLMIPDLPVAPLR